MVDFSGSTHQSIRMYFVMAHSCKSWWILLAIHSNTQLTHAYVLLFGVYSCLVAYRAAHNHDGFFFLPCLVLASLVPIPASQHTELSPNVQDFSISTQQ